MRIGISFAYLTLTTVLMACKSKDNVSPRSIEEIGSVKAREVVIYDEAEHPRIRLGMAKSSSRPQIALFDSHGNTAVVLELDGQDKGRLYFNS